MTDHFLMIIIMSIISVYMISFFWRFNRHKRLYDYDYAMIVMSLGGTSPQPTKTHTRLYPFDKPLFLYLFSVLLLFFVLFARFHFKPIRKSLYKNI